MKSNIDFSFIGDILSVEDKVPFLITPEIILQKADSKQITTIKKNIGQYISRFNHYEAINTTPANNIGKEFTSTSDPAKWNYWTIKYSQAVDHDKITCIKLATKLIKNDFSLIFDSHSNGGFSSHTIGLPLFYIDDDYTNIKVIDAKELKLLSQYYKLILSFQKIRVEHPNISKSLIDFHQLQGIPKDSLFLILGVFSILELLLVNSTNDRENSITHQLKYKIPLLNKRSINPLNFRDFVKGPDTLTLTTIIEILYKFRSEIAHGSAIDFENKFKLMKGTNVVVLLMNLLKMTLLVSLAEPDLVNDLKKC